MKTLTATETARNFSHVLDMLEHGQEEVIILRNNHPVATMIPGAPRLSALEALSDLYGVLDDREGEAWIKDMKEFDRPLKREMHDPWA